MSIDGSKIFPAFYVSGKPVWPITVKEGFRLLFSRLYNGFFETGCVSSIKGYVWYKLDPRNLASS